jgi:hypothetical protein
MADERQIAKEAAISAFEHSADAILTLLEQEGAAHAAVAIEVAKAATTAVHVAREGDRDAFEANTLAASMALGNSALSGAPDSAVAFNNASVALARAFGSYASGLTQSPCQLPSSTRNLPVRLVPEDGGRTHLRTESSLKQRSG